MMHPEDNRCPFYPTAPGAAALAGETPSFLTGRNVLASASLGQGVTCKNRGTSCHVYSKKVSPCKGLDISEQEWNCDIYDCPPWQVLLTCADSHHVDKVLGHTFPRKLRNWLHTAED